jgi:hypothetical protein
MNKQTIDILQNKFNELIIIKKLTNNQILELLNILESLNNS